MPTLVPKISTTALWPCDVCGRRIPDKRVKAAKKVGEWPKYCGKAHAATARSRRRRLAYGVKPANEHSREGSRRRREEARLQGKCIQCLTRPAVPPEGKACASTCKECREADKARRRLKTRLARVRREQEAAQAGGPVAGETMRRAAYAAALTAHLRLLHAG
jgi:hypothetical protein